MAWAYLMRNGSMMVNPFEYRQTMWDAFYEGEVPKATPKPDAAKALPRTSRGMTTADKRELAAFMDSISQIKQSSDT